MTSRREKVLLVLSFAAIHIVWGSTYLAIRFAVETIPPLVTAGLRHLVGGFAIFRWCWLRGLRPTREQWKPALILGVLFFLIGHGSLHWAEEVVPSGIAALIMTTEPVMVTALSAIVLGHRVSRSGLAGMIIGIAGVAVLVGKPAGDIGLAQFAGSMAIIFGALSWSSGMIYSRTAHQHPSPLMSAAMSLLCGGTMLLVTSIVTGNAFRLVTHPVSMRSLLALLYLIVLGSLTFVGYTWLLTRASPILISTHAYTNPLIAVLLGALLAGERVTPRVIIAAAAILTAIVLVRRDTVEPA